MILLLAACHGPALVPVTLSGTLSPTDAHAAVFGLDGAAEDDVEVRCVSGDDVVRGSRTGPGTLTLRGLLADHTYTCAATAGGTRSDPVSLDTPPLPERLVTPEVGIAGDPALVGLHLVNVGRLTNPFDEPATAFTDPFLVLLDADGQPRWQYAGIGAGDIDATWLGDGRILVGGFAGETSVAPTILTLDGEILFSAPAATDTPWEVPASWHHDAGLSSDGTSVWTLTQEFQPTAADPTVSWEGFVVKQIDLTTGATLWAWSSIDDGVASGALSPGTPDLLQPFHANAVWDVEDPAGTRLYVSLRNQDAILCIDVATRAVLWTLGPHGDFSLADTEGAALGPEGWFYGQHDIKRIGDDVVVFDNGLMREPDETTSWSRALVLSVDEDTRSARVETSWRGATDWLSPVWGGADLRDDGLLDVAMAHFWWITPDSYDTSALALVSPDSAQPLWRVDFPDREIGIYRSDTVDGCALGLPAYCE